MAGAHGNRTHPPPCGGCAGFEVQGAHQEPFHSRGNGRSASAMPRRRDERRIIAEGDANRDRQSGRLGTLSIAMVMKLARDTDGARTRVIVRGSLEGASCNCLRHFWEAHCVDPPPQEIVVDLTAVDHVDPAGLESLRYLVAKSRERGTRVSLVGAAIAGHGAFPPPESSSS